MIVLLNTVTSGFTFVHLHLVKSSIWDGVTNPVAVKHLREMKAGDGLVIYHTGDERRAIGTASVVSVDASDPKNPMVKIKVGQSLPRAVDLSESKSNNRFKASPRVRH